MRNKFLTLVVFLALAMLTAACSSRGDVSSQAEAVSALSQEEAKRIIENAMQGFEAGDYAAWSRDWSDEMKNAISETDFLAFREQTMAQYGAFEAVDAVEMKPGSTEGYVRWSALLRFEKGQARIDFSFPAEGELISGIFPEAVE